MGNKNYNYTINVGQFTMLNGIKCIQLDQLVQELTKYQFNKVNPIHECVNKSYLVGLLYERDKNVAIFCSSEELAQQVYIICKDVADKQIPQELYSTNEERYYHMFEIECDGYDMSEELTYYLIKDPIWAWVKFIYKTYSRASDNKFVVVFNRLLSEQEMGVFQRTFDSTNLSYNSCDAIEHVS